MRTFPPAAITYGSVALATFLWGAGYVMFKVIVTELGPYVGSTSRFVVATTFMAGLFVATQGARLPDRADVLLLMLMGIAGPAISSSLLLAGLDFVSATEGTLILAVGPLIVAVMARIFLREPLTIRAIAGAIISFPGIALILFGAGNRSLEAEDRVLGLALLMGSSIAWAIYMLLSRLAVRTYTPFEATTYAFVVGTIVLLPVALPFSPLDRLGSLSTAGWLSLLVGSTLGSALPFVLWNRGVQFIGASRTAVFNNAIPVWTAIISAFTLGDRLTWAQWLGAGLVLGGMVLATTDRTPAPALRARARHTSDATVDA